MSTRREALERWDFVKKNDRWRAERGGRAVPGTSGGRKDQALKKTAVKARGAGKGITVRIHKEKGGIQEERTYPRSADPRKSKG